jgi:hypothetical protein
VAKVSENDIIDPNNGFEITGRIGGVPDVAGPHEHV